MSAESSPLVGPSMPVILRGAFDAIRSSLLILGVFLISGILQVILPSVIDTVVRLLFILVGVVIAYQALGGQTHTDSPFVLRLFFAFLATLASYLLFIAGIFMFVFSDVLGLIGFLVLVPLGLYVYTRLFLSTPAAMFDGYGPAEALFTSWRLMNGSILATTFALVLVFLGTIFVLLLPLLVVRSSLIVDIGGTLIFDTFVAGMQAFLYLQLRETP